MTLQNKHIHFIAIGGSAMHNLAIALKNQGFQISGSDDEIFEPSRSRLLKNGILPDEYGWFPDKITDKTEAVILGMHAREENPELKKAQQLGIPIYSFPEYVFQASKKAIRVVISGSHGKSTITSMILHVLQYYKVDFDYLVGAGLRGFDNMVKLSNAPLIVLEGDEYFTSTLDKTPKFLRYNHTIGLISGIAWDHINAFPTKQIYVDQFQKFINHTPTDGKLIYFQEDTILNELIHNVERSFSIIGYKTPKYIVNNNNYTYYSGDKEYKMNVFGKHNMQNIAGALEVLKCLSINETDALFALMQFKGANNRLESVYEDDQLKILKDFAHSPSKLKASKEAVKERFPSYKIINCYELHTFSSLNKNFLSEYKGTFEGTDTNIIFINEHTLEIKKMPQISDEEIRNGFENMNLIIVRTIEELQNSIMKAVSKPMVLLMMSSGNFGNIDYLNIAETIKQKIN